MYTKRMQRHAQRTPNSHTTNATREQNACTTYTKHAHSICNTYAERMHSPYTTQATRMRHAHDTRKTSIPHMCDTCASRMRAHMKRTRRANGSHTSRTHPRRNYTRNSRKHACTKRGRDAYTTCMQHAHGTHTTCKRKRTKRAQYVHKSHATRARNVAHTYEKARQT